VKSLKLWDFISDKNRTFSKSIYIRLNRIIHHSKSNGFWRHKLSESSPTGEKWRIQRKIDSYIQWIDQVMFTSAWLMLAATRRNLEISCTCAAYFLVILRYHATWNVIRQFITLITLFMTGAAVNLPTFLCRSLRISTETSVFLISDLCQLFYLKNRQVLYSVEDHQRECKKQQPSIEFSNGTERGWIKIILGNKEKVWF
jgi:hypothetical protein